MNAQNYWQLFLETGAPEMYLLYSNAKRQEYKDVFEDSGLGSPRNSIQ